MTEEFSLVKMVETLDDSRKKVRGISFGCACEGCQEATIKKSHLIQRNPFLYSIADDKKEVFQIVDNEIHPVTGGLDLSKPRLVKVGRALYLPLFCKKHDSELFKPIETKGFDIHDVKNQILFSYRAICAQRYLEQKRLALYENNNFHGDVFEFQKEYSQYCIERFNLSVSQLWNDMQSTSFNNYVFKVISMPRVPICLSDCIVDEDDLVNVYFKNKLNKPINSIYAHLLPFEDKSILIIGFNKKYVSKKQRLYYNSWNCLYDAINKDNINGLLIRCKNWCCHPDYIPNNQEFVENWDLQRFLLAMEE